MQLYSFLSRRTDSAFNTVIHKRLNQSRLNRYPISLSRIAKYRGKQTDKIVAIVGTVTNDVRLLKMPENLRICALRFTEQARKRIHASKGECLTFDQLAQKAPTGKGVMLLRGTRDR
jgi:large subunit ribosomal protein L18e